MSPFEELYGQRCRSPVEWFEIGESAILGSEIVHDAMDKVKIIIYRLSTTYSRQPSYASKIKRTLEFEFR